MTRVNADNGIKVSQKAFLASSLVDLGQPLRIVDTAEVWSSRSLSRRFMSDIRQVPEDSDPVGCPGVKIKVPAVLRVGPGSSHIPLKVASKDVNRSILPVKNCSSLNKILQGLE